jgi:glucosamine--fructose-6-phosphate aminotransferase (isomerizing)
MSSIIGAVSQRNIVPAVVKVMQHLTLDAHGSCGLAVHGMLNAKNSPAKLFRMRSVRSIADLTSRSTDPQLGLQGTSAMGHIRSATQDAATLCNVHPHFSYGPHADLSQPAHVAVVHNGSIDNHQGLRTNLMKRAYTFTSQTDTEVIAHLLSATYQGDALQAVQRTLGLLQGTYALAVMFHDQPQRIFATHSGLPLILGILQQSLYIASEQMALPEQTEQVVYLCEGDVVDIRYKQYAITDRSGRPVKRPIHDWRALH